MNSRIFDLLSLAGALLIVVFIAFVMKPGMFDGGHEAGSDLPQMSGISDSKYTGTDTGNLSGQYSLEYLSKSDEKNMLAGIISGAMDYYDPVTRNFAVSYISDENTGPFTIAQACDIWGNSVNDWKYEYDKYGIWDVSSASNSINTGLAGDSNDYAVFLASLLKSAGGQARIKLAQSRQGEHTYAELYLGNGDDFKKPVINSEALLKLKSQFPFAFSKDPMGLNVFKYKYGIICPDGSGRAISPADDALSKEDMTKAGAGELYSTFYGADSGSSAASAGSSSSVKGSDGCWYYVKPFEQILYEPENYGDLCYQYPKLIEYLLLSPDTSVIEFQMMYLGFRYGGYNLYSEDVFTLRDIPYTCDIDSAGDKAYWLRLEMTGRYPGDSPYSDTGYSTVFYSDSSYKDVRSRTLYS